MRICAWDTETYLIGPGAVAPKLVCCQWKWADQAESNLLGNGDPDLHGLMISLMEPGHLLVGQNIAYDLRVACNAFPDLEPLVWAKLEAGEITDTKIREMLLNLATTGKLSFAELPDGSNIKIGYHLSDFVMKYLGIDISEDKIDPASWRFNFYLLDGKKACDYPESAAKYAKGDPDYTLKVYQAQEARGIPMVTQEFRTAVDFALFSMTETGMATNAPEYERVREMLQRDYHDLKNNAGLIEAGILREAVPPRLYRGRMTKGKEPSINMKALQANVKRACETYNIPLQYTDTGLICTKDEVIEAVADYDPVLEEFHNRKALEKLVSTELPRMEWEGKLSPIVHFPYKVLVETTRTSSAASDLYPSANGQNIDPRAKGCYKARDGMVLLGADYSTLELATLGQTCYNLFGKSTHRDIILAGRDNHCYLAGPLAERLSPEFKDALAKLPRDGKHDFIKALSATQPKAYKHWRGLAKPTGLGNPGALGPVKFLSLAKKKPYFVDVRAMAEALPTSFFEELLSGPLQGSLAYHFKTLTKKDEDQFEWFPLLKGIGLSLELRRVWFDIYPEMKDYFDYVKSELKDHVNSGVDFEGEMQNLYAYRSPMGALRAGCAFTSVANGFSLQTPAAEGATGAVFRVGRACRDPSLKSILYGCRPLLFIHDEIIVEIPEDNFMHERAEELQRLMIDSMAFVCPDVPIKTEPVLMRVWSKDAKSVFDSSGRLAIWSAAA